MKIIIFLISASIIGMVSTTGESSSHEDMKTCVYGKDQACNHALFLLWLLEKECVITIRSVYINLERLEEVFKRLSRSGRHHDYAMQKTRKHARCQVCATIDNPRIRNQRDCLINWFVLHLYVYVCAWMHPGHVLWSRGGWWSISPSVSHTRFGKYFHSVT